jgi:predicted O-linked N-acetylglucosamine transferase (SPINDLY family)
MTEESYSNVLQLAVSGQLPLAGLIDAAGQLSDRTQTTLARQLYRAWIEHNPSHPELYVACFNCAALDGNAQDLAAAAALLDKAIALNPDFTPAYINLGRLHEDTGAPDRAVELWRMAASRTSPINGDTVFYATTALTQSARVFAKAQKSEEAEKAIRRCLDINPHQPDVIEQYTALRLAECKWPVVISSEYLDRNAMLGGTNPLSMATYTDDPLLQLASAYRYVKRAKWDAPRDRASDRRNAVIDLGARRLRVGYVSSDLRDHAIGYLMAELFELHNKRDIEVFAYYCGPRTDHDLTKRIKASVEHWIDIGDLSDAHAARCIAADGIDILVDVNGHTRFSRTGIFAHRPAPIQVNWLGYPGSMGTPYHQYLIADDWIIPPDAEIYYSEKVVRLPCYQANDRKRVVPAERPTRAGAGLPEDAFVFCCFNSSNKISRFTFERWLTILRQVPGSVLWLLDTTEQTKARLGDFAEKNGVSRSRLIFAPRLPNAQHLARYPLADLFLDTTPYGAHTTASDALWMGVPVLTLSGRSFASRVCGSLVRAAGLADLVFSRSDDYVARAIDLAGNRAQIAAYKTALRAQRDTCKLFNMDLLVGCLENLYRGMCAEHQQRSVPQPDLTNLDSYFDAGIDHDHDRDEMLGIADYRGMYRAKLARIHLARPLPADRRLWRPDDIAAAELPGPELSAPAQSGLVALRDLAISLKDAGQSGQALQLLQQLATSHPGDAETLRQSARLLNEQGRILECLHVLLSLKAFDAAADVLIPEIRSAIDPAIECFNQCLAAGNVEQAAQYADALAALLPGNVAVLNSALSCSIALGRKHQIEKYTASLVNMDALQGAPAAANDAGDGKAAGAPMFKMSPQRQQNMWLMDAIRAALGPASTNLREAGARLFAGERK